MNGTLRELIGRVEDFRARTGRDLDGLWITHERWRLLPQDFRHDAMDDRFKGRTASAAVIQGVPVRFVQILPPPGR